MDTADKKALELANGRTVTVEAGSDGETVEFRAAGGDVELRIRMTEDGPVVQLSGAKVEITAAESIQMKCKEFEVQASDKLSLQSKDELSVTSSGKMHIESEDENVIKGKMIYLN